MPAPVNPTSAGGPGHLAHAADTALQRVADASIWLLFRLNRVRS